MIFEEVVGDTGASLLPEITAPTLLVAAEHDQFVPRRMTNEMRDTIPGARLEVYEHATHYLPLEHAVRLGNDLEEFVSGTSGHGPAERTDLR